jgi:hypothetical protein
VTYVLLRGLRRLGLKGTELERAQVTTIRLRLMKIGARIRITVRKVWLPMAPGYPPQRLFAQVYGNLRPAVAVSTWPVNPAEVKVISRVSRARRSYGRTAPLFERKWSPGRRNHPGRRFWPGIERACSRGSRTRPKALHVEPKTASSVISVRSAG